MWNLPAIEIRNSSSVPSADTDVIGIFQDPGKKPLSPKGAWGPIVERFRKKDAQAFTARHGSLQYLRFTTAKGGHGEDLLMVGLGTAADLTEEKMRNAGGNVWNKLKAEKSKVAAIHADLLVGVKGLKSELTHSRLVRAFAEGLILSAYQFDKYKTKSESDANTLGPTRFIFVTEDKTLKQQLEKEIQQIRAVGEAVRVTRDWSNEPSNMGTPEYFASEAKKLSRKYGLKCRIMTERDAAREKMGLYLGVGQGAEREGRIVVLEYKPKGAKNPKTLALVGKGITFDSGGISIKPSARMEEMKHDMTGAATVMGAMILASQWKVPNRVIAIMAFTENMPDGNAIQPGNILKSRAGKTVEVINTDAEGRLILADALDYAQDFKPDAIVDIATLTGAVSVALGKLCCGILGNDDALIESVRRAGDINGERIWQLPLWDEYFEDLKSETADMKNSANDTYGGTIRGAIFLKQFIRKGVQWAHLDIAATTWNASPNQTYLPKRGANGAYVRTLAQLAADF